MTSLCVFCGSSSHVQDKYFKLAENMGKALATAEYHTVYGGGRVGLMGALADASLKHGGQVTGIIPRFLQEAEIAHSNLTNLILTETMHERQFIMAERSDGFIILPGGLGTLAEFFEVLTWKQLNLHKKPIILLNSFNYWDGFLRLVKTAKEENFIGPEDENLFHCSKDIPDAMDFLNKSFKNCAEL